MWANRVISKLVNIPTVGELTQGWLFWVGSPSKNLLVNIPTVRLVTGHLWDSQGTRNPWPKMWVDNVLRLLRQLSKNMSVIMREVLNFSGKDEWLTGEQYRKCYILTAHTFQIVNIFVLRFFVLSSSAAEAMLGEIRRAEVLSVFLAPAKRPSPNRLVAIQCSLPRGSCKAHLPSHAAGFLRSSHAARCDVQKVCPPIA